MSAQNRFVLNVNSNEYVAFEYILLDIKSHISKKQSIPHDLAEFFFSHVEDLEKKYEKEDSLKASELTNSLLEKLSKTPGYNFRWRDTIIIDIYNVKKVYKNTLDRVLYSCIRMALWNLREDTFTKDNVVLMIFDFLSDRYQPPLVKSRKNTFTHYKHSVLTGLISMSLGFKVTQPKNPTNAELFQAVRNVLKKIK